MKLKVVKKVIKLYKFKRNLSFSDVCHLVAKIEAYLKIVGINYRRTNNSCVLNKPNTVKKHLDLMSSCGLISFTYYK